MSVLKEIIPALHKAKKDVFPDLVIMDSHVKVFQDYYDIEKR